MIMKLNSIYLILFSLFFFSPSSSFAHDDSHNIEHIIELNFRLKSLFDEILTKGSIVSEEKNGSGLTYIPLHTGPGEPRTYLEVRERTLSNYISSLISLKDSVLESSDHENCEHEKSILSNLKKSGIVLTGRLLDALKNHGMAMATTIVLFELTEIVTGGHILPLCEFSPVIYMYTIDPIKKHLRSVVSPLAKPGLSRLYWGFYLNKLNFKIQSHLKWMYFTNEEIWIHFWGIFRGLRSSQHPNEGSILLKSLNMIFSEKSLTKAYGFYKDEMTKIYLYERSKKLLEAAKLPEFSSHAEMNEAIKLEISKQSDETHIHNLRPGSEDFENNLDLIFGTQKGYAHWLKLFGDLDDEDFDKTQSQKMHFNRYRYSQAIQFAYALEQKRTFLSMLLTAAFQKSKISSGLFLKASKTLGTIGKIIRLLKTDLAMVSLIDHAEKTEIRQQSIRTLVSDLHQLDVAILKALESQNQIQIKNTFERTLIFVKEIKKQIGFSWSNLLKFKWPFHSIWSLGYIPFHSTCPELLKEI